MIISHRHRFIFVKTEKTASTSLLRVFRDIAGEKDRLYPADRSVRRVLLGAGGGIGKFSFVADRGGMRRVLPGLVGLHRHARLADIRSFLGPDVFSRYTVVTSERNPFDRQVSLYRHRLRGRSGLADFSRDTCSPLYNLLHYNRLDNWGIYNLDGKVGAHHIIRFENLHDDLAEVLKTLGIDPRRYPLAHERRSSRDEDPAWRELYTDAARRRVASWYRRELDYFGYAF